MNNYQDKYPRILVAFERHLHKRMRAVLGNSRKVVTQLVPPRDPDAMANALSRLIADPELRAKMGQAGAGRIRRNFTLETCVENYARLYKGILAGRRLSPALNRGATL